MLLLTLVFLVMMTVYDAFYELVMTLINSALVPGQVTMALNWYILRVHNGQEDTDPREPGEAREDFGMEDLVKKVLVPTERVSEIKGGREETRDEENCTPATSWCRWGFRRSRGSL